MNGQLVINSPELTGTTITWNGELLDVIDNETYHYAYYVISNNGIIYRSKYQVVKNRELTVSYETIESGAYKIQFFVKHHDNLLINKISETAYVDNHTGKLLEANFYKEDIYFNDLAVKYVFHEAPSDHLVVIFPGISTHEYKGKPPVYNYIRTLDGVAVNRLYILDSYEDQFCFCLGREGSRDYERTVVALITKIANELNISPSHIITAGSSKGGSIALYYALTYSYGKTLVGNPQIFISTCTKGLSKNQYVKAAYEKMLGTRSDRMHHHLDNLIKSRFLSCKKKPEMYFHAGRYDYHYTEHLKLFLDVCDRENVPYVIDIADYEDHSLTGTYFGPLMRQWIEEFVEGETKA